MKLFKRADRDRGEGVETAPSTLFGCYVAASILGDATRVEKYSPKVKRYYSGGNRREEVVLEYVFHRLVIAHFAGSKRSVDYVKGFVSEIVDGIDPNKVAADDLELALLEKLELTSNLWNFTDRRNELFVARMAICWGIFRKRTVAEIDLLGLVVHAEADARMRGVELVPADW